MHSHIQKILKTFRNHNVIPENTTELHELRTGKWELAFSDSWHSKKFPLQ